MANIFIINFKDNPSKARANLIVTCVGHVLTTMIKTVKFKPARDIVG